jgi:hypothetical protein
MAYNVWLVADVQAHPQRMSVKPAPVVEPDKFLMVGAVVEPKQEGSGRRPYFQRVQVAS